MIKSMTGFATATRDEAAGTVTATVRSVNHRFLDVQVRLPALWAALEPRVRALVAGRVARGRVELVVTVQVKRPPEVVVEINRALIEALGAALTPLSQQGLVSGALTVSDLLRVPHALSVREVAGAADPALAALVLEAVGAALDGLDEMRRREGASLEADLGARRAAVAGLVERLAEAAVAGQQAVAARLTDRLRQMARELALDPSLLAQEAARLAARADVSEELARLRAHLQHWDALVASPEPSGRRLEFLLQEMQREIATLGAKVEGLWAPDLVVAAKAELEKMREQVQNVE
jgi:uncharacterized protein (TIGR00255 family)